MRKLFLSILLLIGISFFAKAQTYQLNIGVGMLPSKASRYDDFNNGKYDSRSLPIYGSIEYLAFGEIFGLDDGILSAGLYFNYAKHTHDDFISYYGFSYPDVKWRSLGLGARVHSSIPKLIGTFSENELNWGGLDVYVGIQVGYEYQLLLSSTGSDLAFGIARPLQIAPFVGARYLFNERAGVYLELGRTAYGLANFGGSFAF